jgi:hypothetical protein
MSDVIHVMPQYELFKPLVGFGIRMILDKGVGYLQIAASLHTSNLTFTFFANLSLQVLAPAVATKFVVAFQR